MKRVRVSKRVFPALLFGIILSADSVWARTRDEVLDSAKLYTDLLWKPTTYNLLDVKNHRDNLTEGDETKIDGSDGIDDRAFKWDDSLNPPRWVFSTRNWPFEVCSTCTYQGEAYAFAFWDSTATFSNKLNLGRIAGARQEDSDADKNNIIDDSAITRFTGTDCSGFVARAWGFASPKLSDKLGTKGIANYAALVSTGVLRAGDVLNRFGKHTILVRSVSPLENVVRSGLEYRNRVAVTHAAVNLFSNGMHVQRVSEDCSV
jgi:hypothetical protein